MNRVLLEYSKLANFQVFPLHELPALEKLQRTWVRAFLSPQPLDDICKYFGVKITMYFAWLGHYTTALIVPAAVGAIYWVKKNYTSICIKSTADLLIAMIVFFFLFEFNFSSCEFTQIGIIGRNQAVEDVAYVLFSVFNVIWATVYLETWKRRGAELAYRWGTLDQRDDLLVEPRPLFTVSLSTSAHLSPSFLKSHPSFIEFDCNAFYSLYLFIIFISLFFLSPLLKFIQGTLETSPVTGRLEPTYPRWKRNMFRYFVSVPIIAACLFFVFIVMILSFQIQVRHIFLDWK